MTAEQRDRLLVVDDEPQVLVALEDVLSERFVVLKSTSAEHALSIMEQEPDIAVVLTDQRMPRMSGDEFLARLGDSCPARRILVTGFADLHAVIRAVNEGRIYAYITKPWDRTDLLLKVDSAVTQFRLANQLQYERRLLRDLMDNVPDGIYFKGPELEFLRANTAYATMLGLGSGGDLVGKRLEQISQDARYGATTEAEDRQVLASGQPIVDAIRERGTDGQRRWYSETKAPIRDERGRPNGLVCISRDVTERVVTQEALRVSEVRFREQSRVLNSMLDSMGEGVIVTDRAGQFLLFNRCARSILGFGALDIGKDGWGSVYGIYQPDQQTPMAQDEDPLGRVMAGEERVQTQLFVRNSIVSGACIEVTATPLKNEQGALSGTIAVLRDVTAQRTLEQQLVQSQRMEAVGHLAAAVAHDFNNLLTVIGSYARFLADDVTDPRAQADVEMILDATKRATALVSQLLAFSRRQVSQPVNLDLNVAVSQLEKMLRRVLPENIQLVTHIAEEPTEIRADPGQIDQVLMNLVVNARDAMPEGGVVHVRTEKVKLTVTPATEVSPYVRLAVSDNGPGIPDHIKSRLFEPFFTTKAPGRGTGLGLASVSGIVEQSGGHIELTSKSNEGTTFSVYFPSATARAAETPNPSTPAETSAGTETILVVEDDPLVRQATERILSKAGYHVVTAIDGAEALLASSALDGRDSVHLLLTDVVMPGIGGRELAEQLVLRRPNMRVLFTSGYIGDTVLRHGVLEEGLHLLRKPFSPQELLAKVRDVLNDMGGAHASANGRGPS